MYIDGYTSVETGLVIHLITKFQFQIVYFVVVVDLYFIDMTNIPISTDV